MIRNIKSLLRAVNQLSEGFQEGLPLLMGGKIFCLRAKHLTKRCTGQAGERGAGELTMKSNRQEILAMLLGFMVLVLCISWALHGIMQSELILETRRQIYCFDGYVKYIFCGSVLVLCLTLIYIVPFGFKLIGNSGGKVESKLFPAFVYFCFFLSLIGVVACLFIASNNCA